MVLLGTGLIINASEKTLDKERKITIEKLSTLTQLPKEEAKSVHEWLSDNAEVIQAMTPDEKLTGDNPQKLDTRTAQLIAAYKIARIPHYNMYLATGISTKDGQLIVKAASQGSQKENFVWARGKPWGSQLTDEDYTELNLAKFPTDESHYLVNTRRAVGHYLSTYLEPDIITNALGYIYDPYTCFRSYQTISALTTHQTIKEYINSKSFKADHKDVNIQTVPHYLVQIPGRSNEISSKNQVVVAELPHNTKPVTYLTKAEIAAIEDIIKNCKIFEIVGNTIARGKNGALYIWHTEDPNNTSPKEFLQIPKDKQEHNSKEGLAAFHEFLKGVKVIE